MKRDLRQKDQEIGTLKASSESERLERVKIEASVAWRRLSDAQKTELGGNLSRHPSQPISLWFFASDAEASSFSADIAEMLRDAKMLVLPPRPLGSPSAQSASISDPIVRWITGVQVTSTDDPASVSLAKAIAKELNAAGFDTRIEPSDAPGTLAKELGPNVLVGVMGRPNGPQGEYKLQFERDRAAKAKQKATP